MTLSADALRRFRARIRAQAASAKPDPERVDRLAALLTAVGLRQARGNAPDLADGHVVNLAAVRRAKAASEAERARPGMTGPARPSEPQNGAQRDGEPTCYRSPIGAMVHGPGCACEPQP